MEYNVLHSWIKPGKVYKPKTGDLAFFGHHKKECQLHTQFQSKWNSKNRAPIQYKDDILPV